MGVLPLIGPGDIVVSNFCTCGKHRPWMVLWVDDAAQMCCVVAITRQSGYVGAVSTGHPQYKTAGAWVMIQPLGLFDSKAVKKTGVTFPRHTRDKIAKHLHGTLELVDPLDT